MTIDNLDLMDNRRMLIKSSAKTFFYTFCYKSNSFHRIKIKNNKLENRKVYTLDNREDFNDAWISKEEILMVNENKVISIDRRSGIKKNIQVKNAVNLNSISSTLFLLECKDKTQLFKKNAEGNWYELQYFNAFDVYRLIIPIPVSKQEIKDKTNYLYSLIPGLPIVLVREVIKFCDES